MGSVIGRSVQTLAGLAPDWQIVLVDDGSTDDTVEVARRAMGTEAGRLRVIRHEGKRGYGVTVADGLRAARTDYVGFMDGDGQFPTICGTGTEDYFCGSYNFENKAATPPRYQEFCTPFCPCWWLAREPTRTPPRRPGPPSSRCACPNGRWP